MEAKKLITDLNQLLKTDKRQHEHTCFMLLSGDKNKNLRKSIVFELTGNDLPIAKCGLHYVIELLTQSAK